MTEPVHTESRKESVKIRLWDEVRYVTPHGYIADCAACGAPMTFREATMDRYPIPGCRGGTYAYENVRLTCGSCNESAGSHGHQGTVLAGMSRKEKRTYRRALRRATIVRLLPTEVFGADWKPGTYI